MDDSYEFLCTLCPEPSAILLTYAQIQAPRPTCTDCGGFFVPNLADLRHRPSFKEVDETITPEVAERYLADSFNSSLSEVDEATVKKYAAMMKHFRWLSATRHNGGQLAPIAFINDTLLLGIQRLQAAILADYTFVNTVIRVD